MRTTNGPPPQPAQQRRVRPRRDWSTYEAAAARTRIDPAANARFQLRRGRHGRPDPPPSLLLQRHKNITHFRPGPTASGPRLHLLAIPGGRSCAISSSPTSPTSSPSGRKSASRTMATASSRSTTASRAANTRNTPSCPTTATDTATWELEAR
ncbi:MAG: hypothetical protein U1F77_01295 [Kiritimatiellia bacterium]